MDISVIIPTYNRSHLLPSVLRAWHAVNERTLCSYEIIFSDDGSSDDTLTILGAEKGLPIRVVTNLHGGASAARNNAIQHAKGDRVVFAGDDIYPAEDFVQKHHDIGQVYGDSVAILGLVSWHPLQKKSYIHTHITEIGNEQFRFNRLTHGKFVDFRHFYTCNVSVSKKALRGLEELFSEAFAKVNFEDSELSYRLCLNGNKTVYREDVLAYHFHEYDTAMFCDRQRMAGEMAVVFQSLHPEMDTMLGVRKICRGYAMRNRKIASHSAHAPKRTLALVLVGCEELEGELESELEENYGRNVQRILSLIYARLFQLKYAEGVLKKKFPDDLDAIEDYLANRFFDAAFAVQLIRKCAYHAVAGKSDSTERSPSSGTELSENRFGATVLEKVLHEMFGDMDQLEGYSSFSLPMLKMSAFEFAQERSYFRRWASYFRIARMTIQRLIK